MRLLRSILAALAALSLAAPAHALTPSQKWGAPHIVTPTGDKGTPAANFDVGQNNFGISSSLTNYLTDPITVGTSTNGAWFAPVTTLNSWSLLGKFQMPLNTVPNQQQAASNQNMAILGGCTATCSGGTDRAIWISGLSTVTAGRAGELNVFMFNASMPLWYPPTTCGPGGIYSCAALNNGAQTGISNLIPGHNYCFGVYQYGADSGQSGIVEIRVVDTTGSDVAGSPISSTIPNNANIAQVSTTSGGAYTATNTITVASAAGITPGLTITDATTGSAVPSNTIVLSVVGTTLTLSANVTSMGSGDTLHFNSINVYSNSATLRSRSNSTMSDLFGTHIGIMSTGAGAAKATQGPLQDLTMLYGVPEPTKLSAFCNGTLTWQQWYNTLSSESVQSHYALNPVAGVTLADGNNSPGYSATLTPSTITSIYTASPLTHSSAISMNEVGAADIFRVDSGLGTASATGTIYISGTYNAATLGGNPNAIEAQVVQGGSIIVNWTRIASNPSGGTFQGRISGVPANFLTTTGGMTANTTPYNVNLRASNGRSFVYNSQENIYIGLEDVGIGQSQMALMAGSGGPASSNSVSIPSGDIILFNSSVTTLVDPTSIGSGYQSNCVSGYSGCPNGPLLGNLVQLKTLAGNGGNMPGAGTAGTSCITAPCEYTAAGDGIAQEGVSLAAVSNLPVKMMNLSRAGTPVDAWLEGYQATTGTMTDTSNVLSFSPTMTALTNPATGTNCTSNCSTTNAGLPWNVSFFYSIKPGTVRVYDTNGCVIASDAGVTATTAGLGTFPLVSGGCAGTGAVTAGTINYSPSNNATAPNIGVSGSTGLSFASGPTCTPNPCTISYTTLYDGWAGSYARQDSQSHGLFTGIDLFGSTPQNGVAMDFLQTVTGPPNLWYIEQASANSSSLTGLPYNNLPGVSPNFNVFQTEWDYVLGKMENYWWAAGQPMMLGVGGHPRDTGATWNSDANMQQFFLNWGSGADSTTNAIYGGTYADNDLQSLTQGGGGSPHADYSVFGSLRIGRRRGVYDWYLMQGKPIAGSAIVTTGNTHSNATLDGLGSLSGAIRQGMYVVGSQFAAGTYVTAINSTSSVTLSANALGTATGTSVTFGTNYTASTGYEPYPLKIAYNTLTTGNHNAGCGTTGACIDITVGLGSLSSGTALNTCGTNLSGGTYPASGVCPFTGAVGTVVKGFSFGLSTGGTFYSENGDDDSSTSTTLNNGATPALDYGSTCTIISTSAPLVVECVMDSPSLWTVGSTYLLYSPQFNRNGSLASIAVTGGSGYSGCATICNVPLVGTGCSGASVDEWQVGGVVHAVRHARGTGCTTTTGTVALSGSLTGGSSATITPTIASPVTDINDVGYYLYDNAGGFGTTGAAGGSEPGYPFTTQALPLGPF